LEISVILPLLGTSENKNLKGGLGTVLGGVTIFSSFLTGGGTMTFFCSLVTFTSELSIFPSFSYLEKHPERQIQEALCWLEKVLMMYDA
jgi:hypothetical protein